MAPSFDAPPPRQRGGQKGNRNALKHGFYSQLYSPEEPPLPPPGQGRLQGDINLFKILIARMLAAPPEELSRPDSFPENLAILQVVAVAVARLNSLCSTNKKLYTSGDLPMVEFYKRIGLSDSEIQAEMVGPRRRSRGGQPGNRNSLKHGYYASLFDPAEIRKLDQLKEHEVDDEIDLLRLLIKRTVASMPPPAELAPSERLRAVRVITYAVSCVEKLELTRSLVFNHGSSWDDAVEEALKTQRERWKLA